MKRKQTMKRQQMPESQPTDLKLKLHRETLLALNPPDLERVVAAEGTSTCRSGVGCCWA
jgi:hypothetical protein